MNVSLMFIFSGNFQFETGLLRSVLSLQAVIMGICLVLLSEKPSSMSRVVGQQIAKMIFKLLNFYSYIIFGVGGGQG